MDDKKGVSLRQKRTGKLKISAPTLISAPASATASTVDLPSRPSTRGTANSPAPSLANPRPRDRSREDKTTDLVKRRYSTRFNNPPDLSLDPNSIPTLPSIPSQFAVQPPSRGSDVSTARPKLDPKLLKDPNFKAEDYVTSVLSNASEQDIESFQRELRQLKSRADTDLQHSIFANRTQFIKISKEADKLKTELRSLKNLMSELSVTLGQVTIASGGGALVESLALSRTRGNRSSVAIRDANWSSTLQKIWKRVEGSQKYLPAIPGRHVVHESDRWVELNSATWKPRRRVHLILLNDHLLVAMEKKRPEAPPKDPNEKQQAAQLVTLKCWPLQDVQIADLNMKMNPGTGDVGSSSHSINIRVGSESVTFATTSKEVSEKLSLLSFFRQASEELRRKLETENKAHERAQDVANGLSSPFLKAGFSEDVAGKSEGLVNVDGKPQSLRRIENEIDDLDIKIALQSFEEAVARVEQLRRVVKGIRANSTAHDYLAKKLDDRASKLATVIVRYLSNSHSWLSATQKNVDWLVRLGYEDRAREAYLEARSSMLQKRIRKVIFDGDLHLYIYQISYIYFTMIKHTATVFQACFPLNMMSACVRWTKGHVDDFNALLERQLSGVDEQNEAYRACMERAQLHAAMLGEVGLDFKDFVGRPPKKGQA